MPTYEELKQSLELDRFNLDVELERQPVLFLEAAEAAARERAKLDEMESDLKILDAELDKKFREDAEVELRKITESSLNREITRYPKRFKAFKRCLNQRYLVELYDQLKEAMRQRNYSLRDAVALYQAGYFMNADSKEAEIARSKLRETRAERNRDRMNRARRARLSKE